MSSFGSIVIDLSHASHRREDKEGGRLESASIRWCLPRALKEHSPTFYEQERARRGAGEEPGRPPGKP